MEKDEFIEIIERIYEGKLQQIIEIYEARIEEKNYIIKELKQKIVDLEIKLEQQKQDEILINIYNQYNYQTQQSDMSNINQSHSGDGDNVGNDKTE